MDEKFKAHGNEANSLDQETSSIWMDEDTKESLKTGWSTDKAKCTGQMDVTMSAIGAMNSAQAWVSLNGQMAATTRADLHTVYVTVKALWFRLEGLNIEAMSQFWITRTLILQMMLTAFYTKVNGSEIRSKDLVSKLMPMAQ